MTLDKLNRVLEALHAFRIPYEVVTKDGYVILSRILPDGEKQELLRID